MYLNTTRLKWIYWLEWEILIARYFIVLFLAHTLQKPRPACERLVGKNRPYTPCRQTPRHTTYRATWPWNNNTVGMIRSSEQLCPDRRKGRVPVALCSNITNILWGKCQWCSPIYIANLKIRGLQSGFSYDSNPCCSCLKKSIRK